MNAESGTQNIGAREAVYGSLYQIIEIFDMSYSR